MRQLLAFLGDEIW